MTCISNTGKHSEHLEIKSDIKIKNIQMQLYKA